MKAVKKIFKAALTIGGSIIGGPLGAGVVGGALLGASAKKKKVATTPSSSATPIAQRDDARSRVDISRGLLRRRGPQDDILFGSGGIEAPYGLMSLGNPGGQ